ncbi:MAG: hypothetical protein ACI4LA_06835 [Emergencia sp.]
MKWPEPIRSSGRRGSYLVEAVIVIPVFIIAVLMLLSVIPAAAACENITCTVCDEIHLESVKSAFRQNPAELPLSLGHRIAAENDRLTSFSIRSYRYLYEEGEEEDLIQVKIRAVFDEKNPMSFLSRVTFDAVVTARAFTGTLHKVPPGGGKNEDDKTVYIFPQWGKCYHGKNCTYVKAGCQMVYLSQALKKEYKPCRLCNASTARIGSPVFCFSDSGRAYHLSSCRTVERYYIEIKKQDAVSRGYSPCSKCHGE